MNIRNSDLDPKIIAFLQSKGDIEPNVERILIEFSNVPELKRTDSNTEVTVFLTLKLPLNPPTP